MCYLTALREVYTHAHLCRLCQASEQQIGLRLKIVATTLRSAAIVDSGLAQAASTTATQKAACELKHIEPGFSVTHHNDADDSQSVHHQNGESLRAISGHFVNRLLPQ